MNFDLKYDWVLDSIQLQVFKQISINIKEVYGAIKFEEIIIFMIKTKVVQESLEYKSPCVCYYWPCTVNFHHESSQVT